LQNGSDPVLRAMRRRYTAEQAARAVEKVRHAVPGAGVTTDIIVGFPGEGDAEFAESIATADALAFSDMHVFPYSVRPGTGAAFLADHVSTSEKRARVAAMLEVSRRQFLAFRQRQQGQVKPVLWESSRQVTDSQVTDSMVWSGLTDNYVRVSTKSPADLRNTITPARLGETVGETVMAHALP
jgi:threonylcarbamoyladenosine tRNA methylthiotransferase MtaB